MSETTTSSTHRQFPRFYAKNLPRGLGWVLALFGGVFAAMTILAMIQDTSIWLILVSAVMALALIAMCIVGILAIMASGETIDISPEGIVIRLGKVPLFRIPAARIRSVVATTKEYKQGMNDRQVYMLMLYWNGKHPQDLALWFQWSSETMDAFRELLPNVEYLV